MRDEPQEPVMITDSRGVERPLWHFPHAPNGVPQGCPLNDWEQFELEAALGVPTRQRTRRQIGGRHRAIFTGIGALVIAIELSRAEPLWYSACVVALVVLFALIAPAKWIQALLHSNLRWAAVYVLAIAVQAEKWAYDDLTTRGPFVLGVAGSGVLWATVCLILAIIDGLRGREAAREGDPRRNPMHVRRFMLERRLCPSCAAELRPKREADGCRSCASCGGAWRHHWPDRGDKPSRRDPTKCAACGYSVLGLPVRHDGRLICPECGCDHIVNPAAWNSSPRCWNCKRSLRGLPLVNGDRVQCPDCGQWRSGLTEADVRPLGQDSEPPAIRLP